MLKNKTLQLALLFLSVFPLFAIDTPITGLVLDAETKAPMPFTSVAVSGRSIGTISNAEGRFVLNLAGVSESDTIAFSHVGYQTLRVTPAQLRGKDQIYLHPAAVTLSEVAIYAQQLTAEEIVERVREHYSENHPTPNQKQRLFLHKYEKARFPKSNQIHLKASDFTGLDPGTFNELFEKLPEEFVEYQDALIELYHHESSQRLLPIEAISLEESSMQDLSKEMETKLGAFFEDIEQTNSQEDVYYKFRSGILSIKAEPGEEADSVWSENKNDSLHYHIPTGQVLDEVQYLMQDYADIKSKNWEFISSTNKYQYTLGEVTIFQDELVYPVSFAPKKRGLFEGTMYISTSTFALLQLDFAFASGKSNENIQLLGIGHSMHFKKGRVIYERAISGYHMKYIYAEQHETASIERSFSVMKKEKRFLWDKTLNEAKIETELFFDIENYWELLVLDREAIGQEQFEAAEQPLTMKYRKEYIYSPEMWDNATVIAPTSELKKYTRKE